MAPGKYLAAVAQATLDFQEEVREQFRALEKETMAVPLLVREVELLRRELLGNGQPGRLAEVERSTRAGAFASAEQAARLSDAEGRLASYGGRIRGLEKFRWFAGGAIAVLAPLALWALGAALHWLR